MKKLFVCLLLLCMCVMLAVPAAAKSDYPRFCDIPQLLTDEQYYALNNKLDTISERLGFDLVIIVMDKLDGWDPEEASVWLYEEYNYGFNASCDGVILMLSMEERDWVITSTGFGQDALNSDARDYISDTIVPYLSDGEYYRAFSMFADLCDVLVTNAQNGEFYKSPFDAPMSLVFGFVVSIITAAIVTGNMKSKLKSVRSKSAAGDYVNRDTLNVTGSNERYLYSNVSKTPRQTSSSSGSRSSGSSHSSSSGKF